MKSKLCTLLVLIMVVVSSQETYAQRYFSKDAQVNFYSKALLEDIEARNSKGTCVIDFETGNMEFAVLIKAFQFEKALMQEHFNENYMESDKFPKALFKGKIINIDQINPESKKEQTLQVAGDLTIHGVTRSIETSAKLIGGATLNVSSQIKVAVADYGIKIPSVVKDNIAKIVDIHIDAELKKL